MSYEDDGFLTTDEQSPDGGDDSLSWSSESDWEDAQSREDVEIVGGSFRLASTETIIDDFESGDVSDWSETGGGEAQAVTSPVQEGTYAAEVTRTSGSGMEGIYSQSGLDYYPKPGDTFRGWVRITNSNQKHGILYGLEDNTDNGYWYEITPRDVNEISIRKMNSDKDVLATDSVPDITTDEWREFEVEWGSDGDITHTLYDSDGDELGSCSANDTEYDSEGGIMLFVNGGNNPSDAYYDYIRVV